MRLQRTEVRPSYALGPRPRTAYSRQAGHHHRTNPDLCIYRKFNVSSLHRDLRGLTCLPSSLVLSRGHDMAKTMSVQLAGRWPWMRNCDGKGRD